MRSPIAHIRHRHLPRRDARGFTLVEMLITLTVLIVVMGTVSVMVYLSSKSKTASAQRIESAQAARVALDMMAADLRCAGYGADLSYTTPQPQIAYIDSTQVLINANLGPFPDTAIVRRDLKLPLAYDPAGSPRPFPLDGTAWQPPTRYRTGAEVIRYTLDANNDGVLDPNDMASPDGVLATNTPNPDDYVLLRQVYGDSSNGNAGDNGGVTQQIALIKRPGGTTPPMFTVYLKGTSTPWNWANGPIPPAQLANIERVTVKVAAPSANRNSRGDYAETVLSTEVNSMRNVPDFGAQQFGVSGYVFNDNGSLDGAKNPGEPGIPNARVTLGNYSTYTDATGFFLFRVFAGTYTLRHTPPAGFVCYTSPDSFVLNVNTAMSRNFADRAQPGGTLQIRVYEDLNDNRAYDTGEPGVAGVPVKVMPDSATGVTDTNGLIASLFAGVGSYTVTMTVPDTFVVNSTPYPVTGTMSNGGTATVEMGLKRSLTGLVSGKVFRDNNRDGILQSGEAGIPNVWVGVTNNGGSNILGFAYSNASGDYSIRVPVNDPPHTTPYSVYFIPPSGQYPTTSTSVAGLWVQNGANLTGNNFGVAGYTVITLNANRVLSLASADVMENDWFANQYETAHEDMDLILGADAGSTDNISVWFNRYGDNTTLFGDTPGNADGYTRLAPQSVMSIAVDTLDRDATWGARPDLVTGTRLSTYGNFFVWLMQNSPSNYGYLPTSYTTGMNYRTQDNGDVQAVLTLDCAGGASPDIIVGTKSPTAGYGTLEVWQSNDAVTPSFSRVEIYPPAGGFPSANLGEVNAMILSDLDNDGRKDLIVGTKTGPSSGEIAILKNVSKFTGYRFICVADIPTSSDIITSLASIDVNGDGYKDIIAGTQSGTASGNLLVYRSVTVSGTSWAFVNSVTQAARGIVLSLNAADFGGSARPDLAVGWRANTSGYVGGVEIYFTDVMGMPVAGTDPSGGSITSMVPALTNGNFNFGTNPPIAPPYLTDLATGVKISATTGALVVFIR